MGQNQSHSRQHDTYKIIEQLPIGNIISSGPNNTLHFLKQYSFSSQQAYHTALNTYSMKLSNKNQHVLNFQHFTTKSENSFCSTFYKIMLIYQYIQYSLEEEIQLREKESRPFTQKEIWSVLCSCVLAAVHLINSQGRMHSALTNRDIRLTSSGCVKLLSHQMIGISKYHTVAQEAKPKDLAVALLHCLTLKKIHNTDSNNLQAITQSLDCSRDMKNMLELMITKPDVKFIELEQQLFKLVQDDESIPSHSNTPILKTYSPVNSSSKTDNNITYKCPKIQRSILDNTPQQLQPQKLPTNKPQYPILHPLQPNTQDPISSYFQFQQHLLNQQQNPDETDIQQQPQQSQSIHNKQQYVSLKPIQQNINYINSFNTTDKLINKIQPYHQYQMGFNSGGGYQELRQVSLNVNNMSSNVSNSKYNNGGGYGYNENKYNVNNVDIKNNYTLASNTYNYENKSNDNNNSSYNNNTISSSYSNNNNYPSNYTNNYTKDPITLPKSINIPISNPTIITNSDNNNLFTDPKLFSMIQNDLKQIYNRKSMISSSLSLPQQIIPTTTLHNNNNNNNQNNIIYQNNKISTTTTAITQNIESKSNNQSLLSRSPSYHQESIEVIKENSQEDNQSEQYITNYQYNNTNGNRNGNISIKSQSKDIIVYNNTSNNYNNNNNTSNSATSMNTSNNISNNTSSNTSNKNIYNNNINYNNSINYNSNINTQKQQTQNIMNNQQIGFKRKKSTTRQPKSSTLIQQVQSQNNNPISSQIKTIQQHTTTSNQQSHQDQNQQDLVHVTQRYHKGKYTGTKLNNKRHGHGTFYYSQGGKYVGNWKYNKMHRYGVLYYPNSSIAYQGNWQSDQLSGYGVLYNEDVTKLRNPFDYRDFGNVDDYWIKYQGTFCQDNKHGNGKLYLSNGQKFEGQFKMDMVEGDGILFRDDGSTVRGKWLDNKLVKLF